MYQKMYVKIIKKNDETSLDYQVGDVLEIDSNWYGGVTVKNKVGMLVSLDMDEYEVLDMEEEETYEENAEIEENAEEECKFAGGDIVKHFKREWVSEESSEYLYKILAFASHTETNEKLVIYQGLYAPFKTCARPYHMFCSEVDREKYPDIQQKYRFEKVDTKRFPQV